MFDTNGFLGDIVAILQGILQFFIYLLVVRVIVSWINPSPFGAFGRVVQMLYGFTDPILDAVRRRMPSFMWSSGLDFTPLIVIVFLQILDSFLDHIRF